jgi:UDP-glucuronate decarboxylase
MDMVETTTKKRDDTGNSMSSNNELSQEITSNKKQKQFQMKRILVAGGAGFLGIHLCTRLLEMGHEVLCLDNLFTSQRMNILHLIQKYPNFEFVRHDITEPYSCEVDEIYNLACPASPVHYQYNPIKTTKVSFLGAYNLLGLAKRVKGKIFQASTSEIYGDPEVTPQVI